MGLGPWVLDLGLGSWALGLGLCALGLVPWVLGLGPCALGLVPWAVELGPLVLGLAPCTLALGLGSWALGEGRAGSIPEIRDFFSRRRPSAAAQTVMLGSDVLQEGGRGAQGSILEIRNFFSVVPYTHMYIYNIIG